MVSLCKIRLHKMLHRCKFTVFLVEWICCKEVSGGARLVFKLSEKCRPHAHESNFDETQVVDLGYEVRFVVSCTCSCVFYNGFLFMKYILAQEDIHLI